MRCILAAEELGVPYELIKVDFAKGETQTPEYLDINPNARVPALEDGGVRLYESMAINLYLAKKAGGPLAPKDLAEDAAMTMWSIWVMTEIEKSALDILFHSEFLPPEKRDATVVEKALKNLERPLNVLEGALAHSSHLVGGRFTIADLNVASILLWIGNQHAYIARFPHAAAWMAAIMQRPVFQKLTSG